MEALVDLIRSYTPAGGRLLVRDAAAGPFVAVDPVSLDVEVAERAAGHLVVLHTKPARAALDIALKTGARLEVTEVFLAGAAAGVAVRQEAESRCRMTALVAAGADLDCRIDLDGRGAESVVGGVFLLSGEERGSVRLRTNHNAADCRSESVVRGVAGGSAAGVFRGMVYVAPDAQRTDARQQSRNILLSPAARIETQPQLEIYADDVKCSHGATVGQMDSEAVFYMRQRGLDEAQARRLQIEGFVGDVVRRCGIEPLAEALAACVAAKMEEM